jgi:hypothetical protein
VFRYLLKTDGVEFEVSKRPVPKTDQEGRQKIDSVTGYPVWSVEVTAFTNEDDGSAVLAVSIASPSVPALAWRQPVDVIDLEMIPWANKRRNGELASGVAFRAVEIRPVDEHLAMAAFDQP